MKNRNIIMSLVAFGIFAFAGLFNCFDASAFSNYFVEMGEDNPGSDRYLADTVVNRINIECTDGAATYKVSQDYSDDKYTWFRADSNCTSIVFDLNGKTIEQGAVTIPHGATIKLIDSVGSGFLGNIDNLELYNGYNSLISNMVNVRLDYGDAPFGAVGKIVFESGSYQGSISRSSNMCEVPVEIKGGIFYGQVDKMFGADTYTACKEKVVISGGIFSEEPDSKYIADGYEVRLENGKYAVVSKSNQENEQDVAEQFRLTNFFQYMYVGQTNEAYISPAAIAKTANVTSSDDSIVGVSCKDSTRLLGQMMIESEDGSIISKACTISAKKAGKATLHYTTDYGYEGDIVVHVADIDASNYGVDSDSAKFELTARYLSVYIADRIEYTWYTTAPSAVSPDYASYIKKLKEQFSELINSIDAEHKIELKLSIKNTSLDEEEKALLEDKNIAAVYAVSGSILDVADEKTVLEEWHYPYISSLPLPEILKNRDNYTVQVASFYEVPLAAGSEMRVDSREATVKDGKIYFDGRGLLRNTKIAVIYEDSTINTDGTTDNIPDVPNSAGFDNGYSAIIILGASVSATLIFTIIICYIVIRKKAHDKVRF